MKTLHCPFSPPGLDLVFRSPFSTPDRGCCVPTPTQRAIPPGSVNEYQRKLVSKRAYHAMHQPRIRGLAASAGVRLRAKETEISAAPWALTPGKGLYLLYLLFLFILLKDKLTDRSWGYCNTLYLCIASPLIELCNVNEPTE